MRKFYLSAVIVLISVLSVWAQDSTKAKTSTSGAPIISVDSIIAHGGCVSYSVNVTPSVLYDYTSESINNIFSESLRGKNNRLAIDMDFFSNSHIPTNFAYKLLFRGTISNALKDRTDNQIKSMMRLEESLKAGLTYRHHFTKWGADLIVGYHYRQMLNISAPKQAFETAFYGNSRFEGDTANFSNLLFQFHMYNQYTIGLEKKIDYGSYQMEIGAAGSFLQGSQNLDIRTGNTWLYTAPDGEYLGLKYDLSYNSAREGATKFFQINGVGASGDLHVAVMNRDKWKISLDVSDMGFMSFIKHAVNYSGANYVEFRGIALPDLTTFSPQTFDTLKLDSTLKAYLPGKSNNRYSVFMPFTAQLVFSKPLLHDRLVLNVGLQYRHLPGYNAYGFVKVNYFVKPDLAVSASAGAGGYSLFNLGFEVSKSWKYFDVAVGSSNLIGLFVPSYYSGTGLYLKLGSTF